MNSDASGGPVAGIADQGVQLDGLMVPAAKADVIAWLESSSSAATLLSFLMEAPPPYLLAFLLGQVTFILILTMYLVFYTLTQYQKLNIGYMQRV